MPPSTGLALLGGGGVGGGATEGGASSAAPVEGLIAAAAEAAATAVWMAKSRREAPHRPRGRAGLGLWCSGGGFG